MLIMTSRLMAKDIMDVGIGLQYFNYAEYDDNYRFLDGETGLIPGLLLNLKNEKSKSYTELVGSVYSSLIKYDGQTQNGTPLQTDSFALLMDAHFKIARKLEHFHALYTGLGYRYWYRNIHSGRDINGNPVAGLLEEYYWPYLLLGYQANLIKDEGLEVGIDFRYTRMLSAKMDIDFLGYCNYDNASVNLGNRNGWRFSLPIKKKQRHNSTFFITPYYEIIDIGKSNTVYLSRNGALVDCDTNGFFDAVYEPRSETKNFGVELTWLY